MNPRACDGDRRYHRGTHVIYGISCYNHRVGKGKTVARQETKGRTWTPPKLSPGYVGPGRELKTLFTPKVRTCTSEVSLRGTYCEVFPGCIYHSRDHYTECKHYSRKVCPYSVNAQCPVQAAPVRYRWPTDGFRTLHSGGAALTGCS